MPAGLIAADSERLVDRHVHTDLQVEDLLQVASRGDSAPRGRGGCFQRLGVNRPVGAQVVEHLLDVDGHILTEGDLARPLYVLANDAQVGRLGGGHQRRSFRLGAWACRIE